MRIPKNPKFSPSTGDYTRSVLLAFLRSEPRSIPSRANRFRAVVHGMDGTYPPGIPAIIGLYGHIIAIRPPSGPILVNGDIPLRNTSGITSPTSTVRNFLNLNRISYITTSFSALASTCSLPTSSPSGSLLPDAFIPLFDPSSLPRLTYVHHTPDSLLSSDDPYNPDHPTPPLPSPTSGYTIYIYHTKAPNSSPASWRAHRPGSLLLHLTSAVPESPESPSPTQTQTQTILLSMDDGSYFSCILPTSPRTVPAAFASFMPRPVADYARAHGLCSSTDDITSPGLRRQGEWYFLPAQFRPTTAHPTLDHMDRHMGRMFPTVSVRRNAALPLDGCTFTPDPVTGNLTWSGGRGAYHICTRLYVIGSTIYAFGSVRHRRDSMRLRTGPWGSRPNRDHPDRRIPLSLVYRNTALASFSSAGRVD